MMPVFDLHCDILLRCMEHGIGLKDSPTWAQVSIERMKAGGVTDQVFAVFLDPRKYPGLGAAQRALQTIDLFEQFRTTYRQEIALATNVEEARGIHESGRIAIWLWVEGGAMIAEDLALLRTYHRLGVRGMTLTWNANLPWAGSCQDSHDSNRGLNEFGREVVREMNRLGMVVDVSHVSDRTFEDVMAVAQAPVMASHSGCRALCSHPRNLTDDQLRALASTGGVVGIVTLTEYLKDNWAVGWESAERRVAPRVAGLLEKYGDPQNPFYREERRLLLQENLADECLVTMNTYIDHVQHAVEVAGEEHVAIGSDFDGIWAYPVGIEHAGTWPAVAERLRIRGFRPGTIERLMHGNATRVMRQVIGR